ncbi:cell division protein FtsK [Longimycelium tulufanense]|uniref:Cell division protein FtsK n=1 Tax=Longimycelium tulufanense TaxID=907463 RepID=A0A8J3CC70_9PSEU|nr:cell division protein FtsK [Longimycelium tulufanense]GGM72645.1 cell division protein FtsK [Longimycelium tulufanense]
MSVVGSKAQATKRIMGAEFRTALWMVRHPGAAVVPATVSAGVAELGPWMTGGIAGAVAAGTLGWYRAHPETFDAYAAPALRSWRRRWLGPYTGVRWRDLMDACDLAREHRRTGRRLYPRVLRVRAFSPFIDVVRVKLAQGQSLKWFTTRAEELASSLKVERVAVEPVRPGVVALVVQRREPFTQVIPAPEMPEEVGDVDLRAVYLGETEFGEDWRMPLTGGHRLTAGATGAGKNSIPFATARSIAPLIRDGLVRPWVCDPKLLEFGLLKPLVGYRYADDSDSCLELVHEFVADMQRTQQRMQRAGLREVPVSPEWPVNWLILDELGFLVAYDSSNARAITAELAKVASMGRKTHHVLDAYVQEPSKDVVEIRDLFPRRICLRVTSDTHPDMVLGEGMRARGAIADQIPDLPDTAGIGFYKQPRRGTPVRVRAAYTHDDDITELVNFVQSGQNPNRLRAVS